MYRDTVIINLIKKEITRQKNTINLIASENYTTKIIKHIESSDLMNKYAEGYNTNRYYGGCFYINKIEQLTIDRAKILFNSYYANVQPHSGSQANQAVYMALCKPQDTILSMGIKHGGHLSHGHKANFSNYIYNFIHYKTNEKTGYIDYEELKYLANKFKPTLIIAGASSYSRIINWRLIKYIANINKSLLLADISHIAGLIATNLYPSPINIADVTTSTTQKTLRGPRGGIILAKKNLKIENKINKAVFPGIQGGPFMHTIAAKAACFKNALQKKFKIYQKQILINTKILAIELKKYNFTIISNGTNTHLITINLINKNLNGLQIQKLLEKVNIITNKNIIPYDKLKPNITSGLRLGTSAITTRGLKNKDIILISFLINYLLNNKKNKNFINILIKILCHKYPLT